MVIRKLTEQLKAALASGKRRKKQRRVRLNLLTFATSLVIDLNKKLNDIFSPC